MPLDLSSEKWANAEVVRERLRGRRRRAVLWQVCASLSQRLRPKGANIATESVATQAPPTAIPLLLCCG